MTASRSFNPLHVGAIIGSLRSASRITIFRSFNPLHVGAIIGSTGLAGLCGYSSLSIPFTSGSVVIDERGRPVSHAVVEQGGLGPVDRVFEPGQLAHAMAGGNPLRCSAVTLRVAAFKKWRDSTRGCAMSSTGIAGCDYRENGRSRGWHGRPFRCAGIPPARPIASRQGWPTWMKRLGCWKRYSRSISRMHADVARLRALPHDRLGRAFLNRAHDALRAGLPELAREPCTRVSGYSPGLIKTIVGDPRLCVQMAALAVAPRLAARLFARPSKSMSPGRDRRRSPQFRLINWIRLCGERSPGPRDAGERALRRVEGRLRIRALTRRENGGARSTARRRSVAGRFLPARR